MPDDGLRARAAEARLDLGPEQVGQLERYLDLLWEWRTAVNLTGISDREEAASTLIIGALEPIRVELVPPGITVIDLGSGSGSPGIPLAVAWPAATLTLVEADQRKVAFLRHVAATLGLRHVRVEHARAEALAHEPDWRERFDLATARAVAAPPRACELALPFVRPGGEAWLYLSRPDGEALRAQGEALEPLGVCAMRLERTPTGYLGILEKARPGEAVYPRPEKAARRRPLF